MNTQHILGAIAATLLVSAGARAGDTGFYVGASAGEATQSSTEFDGHDPSFRLFGGYSFGRYFAAEAGYIDGGTQEDTIGSLRATVDSEGYFATVLARLPLGEVIVPYAKLGYVAYDSTTTVSNGTQRASESFSDEDLSYGVGVEFRLGERLRLRVDYEKIDVPDVAFDIYSFAATWRF